jgi:hypothetical protein
MHANESMHKVEDKRPWNGLLRGQAVTWPDTMLQLTAGRPESTSAGPLPRLCLLVHLPRTALAPLAGHGGHLRAPSAAASSSILANAAAELAVAGFLAPLVLAAPSAAEQLKCCPSCWLDNLYFTHPGRRWHRLVTASWRLICAQHPLVDLYR